MDKNEIISEVTGAKTYLGIELGSTRIKAVLIGENNEALASGAFDWENKLSGGYWTYSLEDVKTGVQSAYKKLSESVEASYGLKLQKIGAIGISAMMHGYLVFDKDDNLLVPFRTWRNTTTQQAAEELTNLFSFNIPQRWSVAHLRQAILNGEEHVSKISFMTTLAGYVHYMLTGEKVVGIGEASGMFPIDEKTLSYNSEMLEKFNSLCKGLPYKLEDIMPKILLAGESGGVLTEQGARFLDPSGTLQAGIPLCPPEGDAQTGMTATNSVKPLTGNVSAGTSIFAMVVLEKQLACCHSEIDVVSTPDGKNVAMVHCNNCTSDLDAWIKVFAQSAEIFGAKLTKPQIYDLFYEKAAEAAYDCGDVFSYNFFSGEPVLGLENGFPSVMRSPDADFNFKNFARSLVYSAVSTLRLGMDILTKEEKIKISVLNGHGGFFKTPVIPQKIMASALKSPVAVMASAGEGGAWGIALLAKYSVEKEQNEALSDYLQNKIFASAKTETINPDQNEAEGFDSYLEKYKKGIDLLKKAGK